MIKIKTRLGVVVLTAFWPLAGLAAQCPDEILGHWWTDLNTPELFAMEISLSRQTDGSYGATIHGNSRSEKNIEVHTDGQALHIDPKTFPIDFHGEHTGNDIEGFVRYGQTEAHTVFDRSGDSTWTTMWNPLGVETGISPIDVYIVDEDGNRAAYLFFRDQRMPSLWTYGLRCEDGLIRFQEKNLQLVFEGRFDREDDTLNLDTRALGQSSATVWNRVTDDPEVGTPARNAEHTLYRETAPEQIGDGWTTASPSDGLDADLISQLVESVVAGELPRTHSLLVARHGKLLVEEYFYGFDRNTWHDMRSASKTVAAALVGVAIDRGMIESVDVPALEFYPDYRPVANQDERKNQITIQHLLTMSSGLNANDSDRNSVASENNYQSQTEQPDWIRIALDAPMINEPGAVSLYGSANAMLIGGVLEHATGVSTELFAQRYLFGPMGVHEYKFFLDPIGRAYLGGGMYMRPRDMAKFGQMHLDDGVWNGQRILSENWARESMQEHNELANRKDIGYGYLWWRRTYQVGDRQIESIEARGNGGQFIFVVPSLDLVAVITSGNYRHREYLQQPEGIMERFILPAAVASGI